MTCNTLRLIIFTLCATRLAMCLSVDIQGRHGYTAFPVARQRFCNVQNNFWSPADGSAIPDPMCRKAFQYMLEKRQYPQYQFIQDMEYSANAGIYYNNLSLVQSRVVPNLLCSAGSPKKEGMSLPGNWQTNKIAYSKRGSVFDINFCATAAHDPSFWQVFVTKPGFNVKTKYLSWADLEMVWENRSVKLVSQSVPYCGSGSIYKLQDVPLPSGIGRNTPFIFYVRWQREDPAGEGFYNCMDVEYI